MWGLVDQSNKGEVSPGMWPPGSPQLYKSLGRKALHFLSLRVVPWGLPVHGPVLQTPTTSAPPFHVLSTEGSRQGELTETHAKKILYHRTTF